MESQERNIYIGIDFNDRWTLISYFRSGMKEPETVSTVMGEERYLIPTVSYKGLKGRDALLGFLRRVMRMIPQFPGFDRVEAVTFHLDEIELQQIELIRGVLEELGIARQRVFVEDSKESFCHFAMNQEKELVQHDVVMFRCQERELSCFYLRKQNKTSPKKVEIEEMDLGVLPQEEEERDMYFAREAAGVLKGNIVSAVYLVGDGLEGGWLKESLGVLLRGRRAFRGKNLYTRGACYNSLLKGQKGKVEYVYFGDYKLANNLYLKVRQGNRTFFKELAEAGTSYYEVAGRAEVLLDGEPNVEVWLQAPDSREAKVESLELTGLPERPPKATRLRIELVFGGMRQVTVRITDLGFGSWYPASGKVWEYGIDE